MTATVELDTVHGTLDSLVWFHLDLSNDVLYLRDSRSRNERVFGEETPEGFTLLRKEDGKVAGVTVVCFWEQYGHGDIKRATLDSLRDEVARWAGDHFSLS